MAVLLRSHFRAKILLPVINAQIQDVQQTVRLRSDRPMLTSR
jgi:hypothetical protein